VTVVDGPDAADDATPSPRACTWSWSDGTLEAVDDAAPLPAGLLTAPVDGDADGSGDGDGDGST
jgi:hypothetical protein